MESMLRVGVIASTHGVRGEVKVFSTTDDVNRFKELKQVILDTEKEQKILEIEGVKFFKQMAILKFKGYDSIEAIEPFKGKDLLVTREQAVKLEENENFIVDLIGLRVLTEDGAKFGVLTDVMLTGANDVYVVKTTAGKEVLLPAIPDCVLEVNLEEGFIVVHIMDGLLDL